MKIITGFQDARDNGEDFALTPYLSLVYLNGETIKLYGISLNWGFYSIYIAIGFGIPKDYPFFKILNKKK